MARRPMTRGLSEEGPDRDGPFVVEVYGPASRQWVAVFATADRTAADEEYRRLRAELPGHRWRLVEVLK